MVTVTGLKASFIWLFKACSKRSRFSPSMCHWCDFFFSLLLHRHLSHSFRMNAPQCTFITSHYVHWTIFVFAYCKRFTSHPINFLRIMLPLLSWPLHVPFNAMSRLGDHNWVCPEVTGETLGGKSSWYYRLCCLKPCVIRPFLMASNDLVLNMLPYNLDSFVTFPALLDLGK